MHSCVHWNFRGLPENFQTQDVYIWSRRVFARSWIRLVKGWQIGFRAYTRPSHVYGRVNIYACKIDSADSYCRKILGFLHKRMLHAYIVRNDIFYNHFERFIAAHLIVNRASTRKMRRREFNNVIANTCHMLQER